MLAVLRASCFCWREVPWLGGAGEVEVGGGEAVESFEKREPRFEKEGAWDWVVVVGEVVVSWSLQGLGC